MIPFLIAGAALVGLGAHASASMDNDEAREKNNQANEIIDEANKLAQNAKTICEKSMDSLAREKTAVLQGNMKRFVKAFSKIKPVNFVDTGDLFERSNFSKNELTVMQTMVSNVQKVSVNDVVGGVSGAALALGAADIAAGGAIIGSGISVGGLTGGAALGAIAAPVFAISGIFSASEASANLEKAKSNLSKAKAYKDECETYSYFAQEVSKRCTLFYNTLHEVNKNWFSDAVEQLELLVYSKQTFGNFIKDIAGKRTYTQEEMKIVASAAALAKMVKMIIDTSILDNQGHVSRKSEIVIDQIKTQVVELKKGKETIVSSSTSAKTRKTHDNGREIREQLEKAKHKQAQEKAFAQTMRSLIGFALGVLLVVFCTDYLAIKISQPSEKVLFMNSFFANRIAFGILIFGNVFHCIARSDCNFITRTTEFLTGLSVSILFLQTDSWLTGLKHPIIVSILLCVGVTIGFGFAVVMNDKDKNGYESKFFSVEFFCMFWASLAMIVNALVISIVGLWLGWWGIVNILVWLVNAFSCVSLVAIGATSEDSF